MTTLGLFVGVLGIFVAIVGAIALASPGNRLNLPAALQGHEFRIIVLGFVLMSLGLFLAIVAK